MLTDGEIIAFNLYHKIRNKLKAMNKHEDANNIQNPRIQLEFD